MLAFLLLPSDASAFDQRSGDFRLKFEGQSWFEQVDVFAPGQSISKDFSIRNYRSVEEDLFLIVKRSGQHSFLDSKFKLSFYQNNDLILEKTLTDISTNRRNQEKLGVVIADNWTDYRVEATLADVGNEYQGQKTGEYSFVLGFGGIGEVPDSYIPVPGVGGVGGEVVGVASDQAFGPGELSGEVEVDVDSEEERALKVDDLPEVAGEADDGIETSFFADWLNWLIILLIALIVALIGWRYWLILKKGRDEE